MAYLKLLIGIVACSTSVLWIKLSNVDPILLTALRLVIAVTLLSPFAWRDWRRHRAGLGWRHLRDAAIPGVVFAVHVITWNLGVRMTLASNGAMIVNLTPIATPFLLLLLLGERVNRREVYATLLGLAGLAVLFVSDYRVSPQTLLGDLICFGSMLLMAVYLVLGRKFRHHPTNLLYVTPLYATASAVAFAATPAAEPLGLIDPAAPLDWRAEAPWVLLLALLPTIVGHSLINNAMRSLRGQVVSVLNMLQFLFAGVLAWAFLNERPEPAFYGAAALVLAAGIVVVLSDRKVTPSEELAEEMIETT
ncbi:EamA-like transporter family protein [Planctomycetes bacterium MalM25]|nr:EamA-like transporter family protein [Planctomycetes bacterium MalM25]